MILGFNQTKYSNNVLLSGTSLLFFLMIENIDYGKKMLTTNFKGN